DTIYPSEPYAYELFDLRKGIALDGRVVMMATIEDKEHSEDSPHDSGFFVSTDRSTGVMVGGPPFSYVPKADYGAVEGALTYVDGDMYGDDSIKTRLLPLWLSTRGICVGMPSLEVKNLTRTKYNSIVAAGTGAAVSMPDPLNKIILTSNF